MFGWAWKPALSRAAGFSILANPSPRSASCEHPTARHPHTNSRIANLFQSDSSIVRTVRRNGSQRETDRPVVLLLGGTGILARAKFGTAENASAAGNPTGTTDVDAPRGIVRDCEGIGSFANDDGRLFLAARHNQFGGEETQPPADRGEVSPRVLNPTS